MGDGDEIDETRSNREGGARTTAADLEGLRRPGPAARARRPRAGSHRASRGPWVLVLVALIVGGGIVTTVVLGPRVPASKRSSQKGDQMGRDAAAHCDRGRRLLEQRDLAGALRAYEEARAAAPDSAVIRVNLGTVHLARGENEAALREAEVAMTLDPTNAQARSLRGMALLGLERVEEAFAALHEAFVMDLGNEKVAKVLVGVALRLGRFQDASDALRVLVREEDELPLHVLLQTVELKLGRREELQAEYAARAERRKDAASDYLQVRLISDPEEREARLGALRAELGRHGYFRIDHAEACCDCGDYDRAEAILAGLPQDLRTADGFHLRARIAAGRGELDRALRLVATASAMDAGHFPFHLQLLDLHIRTKRWDDAKQDLARIGSFTGAEGLVSLHAISLLNAKGDEVGLLRALNEVESRIAEYPDWVPHRLALLRSRVAWSKGDHEEALRALEVVEDEGGEDSSFPEAQALRGEILLCVGRRDEARAAFEAALAVEVDRDELPQDRARLHLGLIRPEEFLNRVTRGARRSDASTWTSYALAMEQSDRKDEAQAAYRRAEMEPEATPFQLAIARRRLAALD